MILSEYRSHWVPSTIELTYHIAYWELFHLELDPGAERKIMERLLQDDPEASKDAWVEAMEQARLHFELRALELDPVQFHDYLVFLADERWCSEECGIQFWLFHPSDEYCVRPWVHYFEITHPTVWQPEATDLAKRCPWAE